MQPIYPVNNPPKYDKEKRKNINQGILRLITEEKNPNPESVFLGYTGKGGLHGLEYKDFANRNAYSKAKREIESGQFLTPAPLTDFVATLLSPKPGSHILDLCCGSGAFANPFGTQKGELPFEISGCDTDKEAIEIANYLFPNANYDHADMRGWSPRSKADYAVGNPPFALRMVDHDCPIANETAEASSEEIYLWKLTTYLKPIGSCAFICPAAWPNDDIIYAKAKNFLNENFDTIAEILLPHHAFQTTGCTSFPTKILLLQKVDPQGSKAPDTIYLDATDENYEDILSTWKSLAKPYFNRRNKLESQQNILAFQEEARIRNQNAPQFYELKKYLYHLRHTAHLPDVALEIQELWKESEAPTPPGMTWEEWEATRPKKENILRKARKALKHQNQKEEHTVRVIWNEKGLLIKAKSAAARSALRKQETFFPKETIAKCGIVNISLKKIANQVDQLNNRKKKTVIIKYDDRTNWTKPARKARNNHLDWQPKYFLDSSRNYSNEAFEFTKAFYESLSPLGIKPNEKQMEAIAYHCEFPAAWPCWEKGVGKTLAALCIEAWKRKNDPSHKRKQAATLIVSSSLCIKLQWLPTLKNLAAFEQIHKTGNLPTNPVLPKTRTQILEALKTPKTTLLLTHHTLIQHKKLLSSLRKHGKFTSVIVDESDEFSNKSSKRTRALLHVAKKIPNRILATGTPVRNHAQELYSQLELLFGSSFRFTCVAKTLLTWNKKEKMFLETTNYDEGSTYKPYGGYALFGRCHCPRKPTVFGEMKALPTIPNKKELDNFLSKIRTRLTLEDVLGRSMSSIKTHDLPLTQEEQERYLKLEEEAIQTIKTQMEEDNKGTGVRTSLLAIAQAILLLQKTLSCSRAKKDRILSILQSQQKTTMIGTIFKASVTNLHQFLAEKTSRPIFTFTGEKTFSKRQEILSEVKAHPGSILITTQQSMRSSLNVPWVQHTIAEGLPWNLSSLKQWAHRAIRFDSPEPVPIDLLVTQTTIEERILGLLLRKHDVASTLAGDGEIASLPEEVGAAIENLQELASYLTNKEPEAVNHRQQKHTA